MSGGTLAASIETNAWLPGGKRPPWLAFIITATAVGLLVFLIFLLVEANTDLSTDTLRALHVARGLAAAASVAVYGVFYVMRQVRDVAALELRFKAVADGANDAIVEADAEGTILYANPAASRLLARDELVGARLASIVPERFREAHRAGLARVRAGGERHVIGRSVELAALRGDGSEVPVELSLAERREPEGLRFTGILRDLSERKAVEAASRARHEQEVRLRNLEAADRMRNEFINNAAHELYTPLTPLKFQIRALRRHATPEMDHALTLVERSSDRLQSTIHQVLRVARMQGEMGQLPTDQLAIRDVVEEALDRLRALADERQTTIHVDLPDVSVQGSATQLVDAFFNLIENAIDYSDQSATVRIMGHVEDGRVVVQIVDQGIGFEDEPARLFQPFVRGSIHADRTETSWGLGLHATRVIVERHHGSVTLESRGSNQGATATVTLPVAA